MLCRPPVQPSAGGDVPPSPSSTDNSDAHPLMPRLLVIDDDRSILHMVRRAFDGSEFNVLTASTAQKGLELAAEAPDVVVLDIILPQSSGFEAARELRRMHPDVPFIFITAQGTSATAIEAMKLGAFDYLLKPLDLIQLREYVERALTIRRLTRDSADSVERLAAPVLEDDGPQIIGRSPLMQNVFKAIGRVSQQNVTVLIQGESGTGKELVARAIVRHSLRADRPFLAVNCAAIPDTLLESELFGHERGAFTDAVDRRIGKFEQCNGGTIFLDEVGDMSPLVQSKVLRLLQEQRFERVGGSQTITTDVRILCATNRDLRQMAAEGTFREDLFYRLDGYSIHLPPLRERGEDIPLLLNLTLRRMKRDLGRNVADYSPEALALLLDYPWPGNVRELEAAVRQALLHTTGAVILAEFLPESIRHARTTAALAGAGLSDSGDLKPVLDRGLRHQSTNLYAEALEQMERYTIGRVLRHTRGNQSHAARLLGITRGCLRNRIRTLHITLEASVRVDSAASHPDAADP